MPRRSHRSARVVICDDVSWSEPAPRGRSTVVESDVPDADDNREWIHGDPGGYQDERAYHAPETGPIEDAFDFDDARRAAASRTASRGRQPRRSSGRFPDADGRTLESGHREASVRRPEPALGGYRVEDYLGDPLQRGDSRHHDSQPLAAPVIDYTDAVDEEEVWGPRPKLLPAGNGGRRTVVITGHAGDGYLAARSGGRDAAPPHTRYGFSADRTAMWAVLLCVIVLLVAITSH